MSVVAQRSRCLISPLLSFLLVLLPSSLSPLLTIPLAGIPGLHYVLERLLAPKVAALLPSSFVSACSSLQSRLPAIPVKNGMLWPGESLPSGTSNSENVELYAVHPHRIYTVAANVDLTLAKAAYSKRRFPCNDGWCQVCAHTRTVLWGIGTHISAVETHAPIHAPHKRMCP